MSAVYDCSDPHARADGLKAAVSAVRSGRLVVLPTDTVYGIGADAFDATAVRALLQAKNRGPDMPVGVLVGSWSTVDGLVLGLSQEAGPSSRRSGPAIFRSSSRTHRVCTGTSVPRAAR